MELIGICVRCGGESVWDNYHEEVKCIPCGYSGNGRLPQCQPVDSGYGKNEIYPQRIQFSIYHPVFEWSSVPVFEKWDFDAVVRPVAQNTKGNALHVLEAVNATPRGLWPDEMIGQRYHYARKVMDRIIDEFRRAIRESIAKRLECNEDEIRGIVEAVERCVRQPDIKSSEPNSISRGELSA